jgi:2-haloacid dehalogenase
MNSESSSQGIECIVFDVYGTIFDLKSFGAECDKIHHGKGEEILALVKEKQFEYVFARSLAGKYREYDAITKSAIKFALEKMHLKAEDDNVEELYEFFLRLKPFPDAEGALNDLDQIGAKVMLLSNSTQAMLDKLVENAGMTLLADEVVSVEGSGSYMPTPRAFQHALDHLELFEKHKILFVSGNSWNAAGAKAFGFKVGWVNRTKQPVFDYRDLTPDYEFPTLAELKSLLLAGVLKI